MLEQGCHRSHPHEEMNAVCQLKTEIACLKTDLADARSALNEHMEIHAQVVNENKDLKSRVERFQAMGESGYISIVVRSREAILHEFCQLQIKYGEQKHEIRQLKAELERKDEELESLCWAYSPAMAEAKINQLNEQLEQAKQERLKHFMLLRELHALVIGNYPEWLREDEHRQLVEGIERTLTETKEET